MMKKELECIICIGVPASGKSTWSKDFLHKNPNYVRINRDDFRFMLRDEPMTEPKIEDLITGLFHKTIDAALEKKLNIILDNTNVKRRYIDGFISYVEHRADIKFMVFDISLETAIERDKNREKSVGEEVIKKMYKDYQELMDGYNYSNRSKKVFVYTEPVRSPELPDITIFDIDGTLSHANGKRGYFDWDKVDRDDLDKIVYSVYKRHKLAGDRIFIVTGRDEEARPATERWLTMHGITYERLLMRKKGDMRPDNTVKRELYENHIIGQFNPHVIYEDRQKVVDMLRSIGLKVFQVSKGDY